MSQAETLQTPRRRLLPEAVEIRPSARRPAWRRIAPYAGSAAALLLFFGALWLMHRQVASYRAEDVKGALRLLGWEQISAAVGVSVASYALLTLYDLLALRHMRKGLPYGRVALASFTSYAFTHSFGFGSLIHATIRYRLYVPLGLKAVDIAELTAFVNITFIIGLLVVFPVVAVLNPGALGALHFGHAAIVAMGFGGLALAALYVVLGWWVRRPISIWGAELCVPRPSIALGQVLLSLADIALAATVLYLCLPEPGRVPYLHVLAVFIVALSAGIISHVPGGLGVFDTIVLVGLQDFVPGDEVLAALLVFRVICFLLPLLVAGALFGGLELIQARRRLRRVSESVGSLVAPGVPVVLAGCCFLAGALLLFSNATPEEGVRLHLLYQMLPLAVLEASHFIGSVVGVMLLLLADGLQRRSHPAWVAAMALLALGGIAALLKGLEVAEAGLLFMLVAVLWASRREFHRRSSVFAQRLTPGTLLALGVVFGSAFWLGLFSYKHVRDSDELWWQFALYGDASRFVRASVAVAVVALAVGARWLIASVRHRAALPDEAVLAQAAEIVAQSPDASANLALLGDKSLLFHPRGDAFLMYGVSRRSWIALGDPVGPLDRWRDLFVLLRAEAERHGARAVFFGVSAAGAPICRKLGFALRRIGEEALVPLDAFSLEGAVPELRERHAAAIAAGSGFEILEGDAVDAVLPALRRISDAWLAWRGVGERGFSSGAFRSSYVRRHRVALVRRGEEIVAFALLWSSSGNAELAADLIRHVPGAPEGTVDFLLAEAMEWGRAHGFRAFDLGLAPTRGLDRRARSRWHRLGTYVYGHGEHFRDFTELRMAKSRFRPEWSPRYVASRPGLALGHALPDLALLVAVAGKAPPRAVA
jgi:phosphatidylglycerol lysyltransferase